MKNFKAEWTGSYPNLCSGIWKLYEVAIFEAFQASCGGCT